MQGCLPRGSAQGEGVSAQGDGVSAQGGVYPRGVSAQEGVADPPVNRMADRCKNITLPQLRCGR